MTPSNQSPIIELTNHVKKIGANPDMADFRLSPQTYDQYIQHIQDHRTQMQTIYDMANGTCSNCGNVGTLGSANRTKSKLCQDDLTEYLNAHHHYMNYLDCLQTTVTAAYTRFLNEDHVGPACLPNGQFT